MKTRHFCIMHIQKFANDMRVRHFIIYILVMGRVVISRVSSGSGISFFEISGYRAGRVFHIFFPGGSGISLLISRRVPGNFHHLTVS